MKDEPSYKHMDDKARQAADHFTTAFNEDAWAKMELLLDKDKRRRRGFFWWWLVPVCLLLLGGSTFFLLRRTVPAKPLAAVSLQEKTNSKASSGKTEGYAATEKNNGQVEKQPETTGVQPGTTRPSAGNAAIPGDASAAPVITGTAGKPAANNVAGSDTPAPTAITVTKKSTVSNKQKTAGKKPVPAKQQHRFFAKAGSSQIQRSQVIHATTQPGKNITKNETTIAATAALPQGQAVQTNTGKADSSNLQVAASRPVVAKDTLPPADTAIAAQKKSKKDRARPKRWDFSLAGTLDYTSVQFRTANKLSPGAGVGIAYHFSDKWSVATGIAVSQKYYLADSTDYRNAYKPNSHYLIRGIDARCTVIEIPLNLQYRFKQGKTGSWLAVAGLSTYLMQKEVYRYDYLYYGRSVQWDYTFNNQNRHFFSILNIAAGYRHALGKTVGIQVTPYLKIPVSGIGQGRVSLYSGGLQVSLHLLK
jgi:hypothetical protein